MARTFGRSLGASLLGLALLSPLGAGASRSAALKSITTRNEIEAIAMDGRLVAYDVGARENVGARCNKVFVWNVRTGVRKRVSGKRTCDADSTSTGAGVDELAVAGTRIAWIVNQGGNTESEDYLYASSWAAPRERKLASAFREGDVDAALAGQWIGGLVGSGKLLAVNRWQTDDAGHATSAKLMRIRRRLRTIASGLDTKLARSADSGRIAVVRENGEVALYSGGGSFLRAVTPGPLRDVALGKDRLLVLTMTNKLKVYNASTGSLQHTWPVKGHWTRPGRVGSSAQLDVSRGIAVYSTSRAVRAVRVKTGKGVLLVKVRRAIDDRLEIEKPGVVYAFDTFNRKTLKIRGHVAFLPMKKVAAALAR